jgi:polysaccharide export outer membrane protein
MTCNRGKFSHEKPPIRIPHAWAAALLLLTMAASCRIEKPVSYFSNGLDTALVDKSIHPELPVSPGDLLSIMFFSDNPEATAIFNQAGGGSAASPASQTQDNTRQSMAGAAGVQSQVVYRVDSAGQVRIHGLGLVPLAGLTLAEAERRLTARIASLEVLSNPYCVVRYSGIRVTVLGEVRAPGAFQTPNDRMTIFDLLGMAGDILPSGRKEEVLLIRDENGRRTYAKLDLTSQAIFRSPHLHLRQNDLVVVQANGLQMSQSETRRQQYLGMAVSAASILVLLLNLLFNIRA